MSGRAKTGGFTLIEVIVGLGILALLAGMIQGIYAASARSRDRAEARTATVHACSSVLTRLCDELGASFISKTRPDATYFRVATDSGERSTLDFATLMPPVHGLRAGGETRVYYELNPETREDGGKSYVLQRSEIDDLAEDVERDGATYDMLKGINTFSVKCFDGTEWQSEWRLGEGPDPKLPLAVKIEVTWGEKDAEQTFRTAATLYGAKP